MDGSVEREPEIEPPALDASARIEPAHAGSWPLELTSCAFSGTIVRAGTARGVAVRTGNVEVLFTDKIGTLTIGEPAFGAPSARVLRLALLCSTSAAAAVEGSGMTDTLDAALRRVPQAALTDTASFRRIGEVSFDHARRLVSVLGDDGDAGRIVIFRRALAATAYVGDGIGSRGRVSM